MQRMTYTIREAGQMLGICRSTIYKLIGEGRLSLVKIGSRSLIRADEICALVDGAAT